LGVPRIDVPSPLATRRILDTPPIGGQIKTRAEDFLVDELPLYEPAGEGEHLYLRIGRSDMTHHEMLSVLRSHFGVTDRHIGFAGQKDRTAIVSQTVSIHLPHKPQVGALQHERMQVLWAAWHTNKLRRGHLAGNRFSIRIRGIEAFHAPAVWRALQRLSVTGVPDYFGPQRFGMRLNGHVLGRCVLTEQWSDLLSELVGTQGTPFPPSQHEAREHAQAGRWAESQAAWGRGDVAERSAVRALAQGADARRAVRAIPADIVGLWVSAWQSAVFNRLLDQRLEAGTMGSLHLGDVAWKHVNGSRFVVDAQAMAATGDEALVARAERFEISATGLLPGHEALASAGETAQREEAAIHALGVEPALFSQPTPLQQGARRPFRVRVTNPEIEGAADQHGPYVRVAFDLPAGAYATVVMDQMGVVSA
jgi:tRNA pseudouridine13 synthase